LKDPQFFCLRWRRCVSHLEIPFFSGIFYRHYLRFLVGPDRRQLMEWLSCFDPFIFLPHRLSSFGVLAFGLLQGISRQLVPVGLGRYAD